MVVEGHNIIYAGSDTSESSEDEFKDDIYNAVDESEDSSDEDYLQGFNTKFSGDDNRPTFTVGMTFSNAVQVRAAIAKYGISRGVSLKYVKNEPSRIRVKCEEGYPFLLLVSKDGSQPEGRHKPIKSLMDYIRKKTMERISGMDIVADKWVENYSPACMEIFEAYKMPGRPKKKRVRAENEDRPSSGTRLRRKGKSVTCTKCKQQGHNTRTCQNIPNSENSSQIPQKAMVHADSGHIEPENRLEPENNPLTHIESTVVQKSAGTSRKRTLIQMRRACRSASMHKAKKNSGMGILYDETSGAMSFSTGNTIVQCTDGSMPYFSDPNLTFPIPNEREYRADKIQRVGQTSTTSQSNRRISIRDVGGPINMASMSIQSPGLQWRGQNCITTRQLEVKMQLRKNKKLSK
ncbi:hypothetical protein POM88_022178 [Heracleum sosnowskyi]|uniref:Transposase MuDR plant domain-containing protein n=1 Tax=Heracleum sosnowskyi TaxID=360622 RepID=A0AAD8IFZ8_9APIA|nr:hypothetical protein POM88_022178 [Heracleum sosnowskyi]